MTDANESSETNESTKMIFEILKRAAGDGAAARLGRLALPNRGVINTPNYIAITSRGAVPHITPDNMTKHTSFGGAYMALEDFLDKKSPPILNSPSSHGKPLHAFTAFPQNVATVLAARRFPAAIAPVGNGSNFVQLFTSTGFQNLTTEAYASAVESLKPDIVIPLADLFHTSSMPTTKKLVRMVERTEVWIDKFLRPQAQESLKASEVAVFAPVLAVEYPIQWDYLNHLSDDLVDLLSGLAIHGVDLMPDLVEHYKPLDRLPRLSLEAPNTPHQILRQVSLGIDICTIPFINAISDAGVALTFKLSPGGDHESGTLPLGVDMWSTDNITSVIPLAEGCKCYACTDHHRAYIHHLLNAKEMLGWTLLQIHNHQVMSDFFADIRSALQVGEAELDEQTKRFATIYEATMPEGTGTRPRARGHHFKSDAGQDKINKRGWENFNAEQNDDEAVTGIADPLPKIGNASRSTTETPLIPEGDSQELSEKGFAELDRKE